MHVQPYLFFEGRCEEALAFYKAALGAEIIMLMRNRESPEPVACAPGMEDKVLHCSFRVGETDVMASDGRCVDQAHFRGFALTLTVPDEAVAEGVFAALSEGGQVQMALGKTFFSAGFGMVRDRFGVLWMVMVQE